MKRFTPIMIILTCCAVTLLQACCTKKYCSYNNEPGITISYSGFSTNELNNRMIYVLDTGTSQVVDSALGNIYSSANQDGLPGGTVARTDMRKYYYIIKIGPDVRDTISGISYEYITKKIKCNQCFPVGDGSENATELVHFSFIYQGDTYNTDSLTIMK